MCVTQPPHSPLAEQGARGGEEWRGGERRGEQGARMSGEADWRGVGEGRVWRGDWERGLGGTRGHEKLVKDAYRTLHNEVSRGSAVHNASDTARSSAPSSTPFTV